MAEIEEQTAQGSEKNHRRENGRFHRAINEMSGIPDIGELLAEWKRDHPQLLKRFDLDGDGELSLREWELARSAARREVDARHREARSAPDLHILHYPEDGRLYLISNMEPEKLASRYQWWAWGHLAVFFAGVAGAFHAFRLAF